MGIKEVNRFGQLADDLIEELYKISDGGGDVGRALDVTRLLQDNVANLRIALYNINVDRVKFNNDHEDDGA